MPMRFKDKIEGTITNADYASSAGSVAWGNVSGKPSTFAPASHTHNYAGSSSAGGSANSAVKLDTSTAGSSTQPVYFSGGKPAAIGYTIQSNVPANAKFTDTTYSVFKAATSSAAGGTGLVPAPAAGAQTKYLRADGTWQTPPDTNTTYTDFTAATASAAGTHGLVPAPAKGQQNYFLRGDKTWQALSKSSVGLGNVDNTADSTKSVKYATSAGSANSVAWGNVSGKPSTFAPSSHTHKYASGFSVSGTTVTVSYGDGSSSTFNTQDTNTDNKVLQTAVKSSDYTNWRTLIWGASNSATEGFDPSNVTDSVFASSSLTCQPSTGTIRATTFKGNLSGTATNATNDAKSQAITGYIRGLSVSGRTITYTRGDGTTGTITTQDTDTTYSVFKAATSSAAGGTGLVPAPAAGAQTKYLRGDGTWQTPPDTNTWRGIQDNLTSTATDQSLSANQGKVLKGLVDGKVANTEDGANGLLSKLTTSWSATPTDNTYFVRQDTAGGNTFGRVKFSTLWTYIKSKGDSAYQAKGNYAAASHTHNYAGSGSAGGSANSAVKLDTATAGSATQPVYFANGKPTACTYTLGKSVPSNAVFTDTHTLTLADRVSGTVVTCDAIPTT